jgi:hypothetical protein
MSERGSETLGTRLIGDQSQHGSSVWPVCSLLCRPDRGTVRWMVNSGCSRGDHNAVWSKTAWNNLVRSYKPAMGAFPNSMLRIGR